MRSKHLLAYGEGETPQTRCNGDLEVPPVLACRFRQHALNFAPMPLLYE
jgi:hypothetical protein